jgi:hypothetical protein
MAQWSDKGATFQGVTCPLLLKTMTVRNHDRAAVNSLCVAGSFSPTVDQFVLYNRYAVYEGHCIKFVMEFSLALAVQRPG